MTENKTKRPVGWPSVNEKEHQRHIEAGIKGRYGDSKPVTKEQIAKIQAARTKEAKAVDNSIEAQKMLDPNDPRTQAWVNAPNQMDIKGVDNKGAKKYLDKEKERKKSEERQIERKELKQRREREYVKYDRQIRLLKDKNSIETKKVQINAAYRDKKLSRPRFNKLIDNLTTRELQLDKGTMKDKRKVRAKRHVQHRYKKTDQQDKPIGTNKFYHNRLHDYVKKEVTKFMMEDLDG